LARIRDELVADRFLVVLAESTPSSATEALVEATPSEGTTVTLFGDPEAGEAEICLVRRVGRRIAVRRATVVADDPDHMTEVLAVRAVELVRATALELSIDTEHTAPPQKLPEPRPAIEVAPVAPDAARQAPTIVASMGVGVWTSIEGPPAAVAPVARIGVHLSDWTWVRVSATGLGSRPRVETTQGSATVLQNLVLAELVGRFRPRKRLRPMLSVGGGALNVAVDGTGIQPYQGRSPQRWSAALDGGVGVALAVSSRAVLVTEVHSLLASPHPVVRFADTPVATIGYPSLLCTLALEVEL
jgi:hypothetical protein